MTTEITNNPRVQFRVVGGLGEQLLVRTEEVTGKSIDASLTETAKRDLERYYSLLNMARSDIIAYGLTLEEAAAITDLLNGQRITIETSFLVIALVKDASTKTFNEKWGINSKALIAKLKKLNVLEKLAIADAAERVWLGSYHKEDFKAVVEKEFDSKIR